MDKLMMSAAKAVIDNDTAWALLGVAARREILSGPAKWGLRLADYQASMEAAGVRAVFDEIRDPDLQYPDYYTKKFHSYSEGNLNWSAAFEAQYAWTSIAKKTLKDERGDDSGSPQEACDAWIKHVATAIKGYHTAQGLPLPKQVVDVGCSVGYSTRGLADTFPEMTILGVDASPYFLAIAETQERARRAETGDARVQYKHAVFEQCDLPDASADMVIFQFMFHECPAGAIRENLERAMHVARPGSVVGFLDMDPHSAKLAALPPFVKTLRWATEPWLDAYDGVEFESLMTSLGLTDVQYAPMDARHHGWFARVPL